MSRTMYVDCRPIKEPNPFFEDLGLQVWSLIDQKTNEPVEDLPHFPSRDFLNEQLEYLVKQGRIDQRTMETIITEVKTDVDYYHGLAEDFDTILSLAYKKGSEATESIEEFDIKIGTFGNLKYGEFMLKHGAALMNPCRFSNKYDLLSICEDMVLNSICTLGQAWRLFHRAITEFDNLPKNKRDLEKALAPKQEIHWIRTHNRPILEKAGVAHGILVLEDGTTVIVTCVNEAMKSLELLLEHEMITSETFDRVTTQVKMAGMEVNMFPIIEKITKLDVPTEACEEWCRLTLCRCHRILTPHGFVVHTDRPESLILHIESLLRAVELKMENGIMLTEHAISIIQQGYKVGMPFTQAECDEAGQANGTPQILVDRVH